MFSNATEGKGASVGSCKFHYFEIDEASCNLKEKVIVLKCCALS